MSLLFVCHPVSKAVMEKNLVSRDTKNVCIEWRMKWIYAEGTDVNIELKN